MVKSLKNKIAVIMRNKLSPSVLIPIKKAYSYFFPASYWCRIVMDRETEKYVKSLDYNKFVALEISGSKWKDFGFASYRCIQYEEYDLCEGVIGNEMFDIIIVEQVLEHCLYPYRAVRNLNSMLKPGGFAVITTPFLIMFHSSPVDCSRWTELGIKYLLVEGGFDLKKIKTGSWGNRACVKANFKPWARYLPGMHSLKNEPRYPLVVWAFAQK